MKIESISDPALNVIVSKIVSEVVELGMRFVTTIKSASSTSNNDQIVEVKFY